MLIEFVGIVFFALLFVNYFFVHPLRFTIHRVKGSKGEEIIRSIGRYVYDKTDKRVPKNNRKCYLYINKLRMKLEKEKFGREFFGTIGKIFPKDHISLFENPKDASLHPINLAFNPNKPEFQVNYRDALEPALMEHRRIEISNQDTKKSFWQENKGLTLIVGTGLIFVIMFSIGSILSMKYYSQISSTIGSANTQTVTKASAELEKTTSALQIIANKIAGESERNLIILPKKINESGGIT